VRFILNYGFSFLDAHRHIFLDLSDTSESNSLAEMERVLENMPEALDLMRQVDKMEKDLRFYGSQLRDGKDMLINPKYQNTN